MSYKRKGTVRDYVLAQTVLAQMFSLKGQPRDHIASEFPAEGGLSEPACDPSAVIVEENIWPQNGSRL